jgi:hypothetical protein
MKETRTGMLRGVGILAALMLAAGAISPAFSAAPLTKAKAKKIATKVLKQKIDDVGNPIFIEEAELVRFGPVTLNVPGTAAIGTFGPFTLTADCADDGGGNVLAQVLLTTTEAHSAFESDDDYDDDFNPGDPDNPAIWAGGETGNAIDGGAQTLGNEEDGEAIAVAPSGFSIAGASSGAITTNFAGFDCWITGAVHVIAPQ